MAGGLIGIVALLVGLGCLICFINRPDQIIPE
jgi:hypothetical protein